jgi:hypothetical protein
MTGTGICNTSRVPAELLWGNPTNAYTFCQSLLSESFPRAWLFGTKSWTSQEEIIPKPNIFTGTRIQDTCRVCDLYSCYLLAETNNFLPWCRSSIVLSFRATETILVRSRTQGIFRCRGLSSCNILAEINNFGPGAVLLSTYFPSNRNHLRLESNQGQFFKVLVFVSVIFYFKQLTLVLAQFFYRV